MLPNIFWSRTDYISGAYATKMVVISSPGAWNIYLFEWLKFDLTTNRNTNKDKEIFQ